jgi:hypothetical protein
LKTGIDVTILKIFLPTCDFENVCKTVGKKVILNRSTAMFLQNNDNNTFSIARFYQKIDKIAKLSSLNGKEQPI